jgi:hypothetical protein
MPLCLLPIKLPSDFSCGLKVSHKALLISYEVESTVIIVLSHSQSQPVQFPSCGCSILHKSCDYCRQSHGHISQWHEVSHKALLSVGSQISFVFPPHKLFFRTHIHRHGSDVKTVILQAIAQAWRHQHITGILAYFGYMRVADTIDSQKSEDCDFTDKLP